MAQRFGVEARFHRPDSDLRPEAALVASGSTFQGSLDERRLSGMFAVYPGPSRFGGHFEVSAFDSGNPWNAMPYELTQAGILPNRDRELRIAREPKRYLRERRLVELLHDAHAHGVELGRRGKSPASPTA